MLTLAILVSITLYAQYGPCDPIVPEYVLDLTGNPDSTWVQPNIIRDGSCCGYVDPPNSCVKFIITLDPEANGIMFNVVDGALPGNLEWQLMNDAQDECDPETYPAGVPVCLDSPGPHYIIFCKPGGNDNTYIINSISVPAVSTDVIVNEGCTDTIFVLGFDETTITWTSVYPGNPGDYNGSLDCDLGCDTAEVTGQPDFPDYVEYQVCGVPFGYGECTLDTICDTIRVYFNSSLEAIIQPDEPVICTGGENIDLTGTGAGGTPPYTYLWNTGETSQTISVGGGTYVLQVSDTSGCPPAYDTIEVVENPSAIEAEAGPDQVVCFANPEVSLSGSVITATGGMWWGGNGIFDPDANSLNTSYTPTAAEIAAGGMWLYLTTTGNGPCPAETDSVYITFDEFNASLFLNTGDVSCNGFDDGNADISVIGGYPPYSYSWSIDPGETGTNVIDLPPGTYTVIITDSLGCDSVLSFTVTEPDELALSLSGNDISCYGGADGSIDLTITGGTSPYDYNWSEGSCSTHVGDLPAGQYNVTVIDDNGCIATSSMILFQPDSLNLTYSATGITCYGYTNGSIISNASGGTPPLTYNIGTGTQSTGSFINLGPGSYQITVTDANGCTKISDLFTISQPPDIQITGELYDNVNCDGFNDGTITIIVSGGTLPLIYDIGYGIQDNGIFTGLSPGNYIVTITDANGCTEVGVIITLTEPDPLQSSLSGTNVSCNGGSNGSVNLTVNGGTPLYTYNWSTGAVTQDINNLPAGTYNVIVTDNNGCTTTNSLIITEPVPLTLNYSYTDVVCYGDADATISATVSGGTPPITYNVGTGAQSGGTFTGLGPGTYQVTITDANGCLLTSNFFYITQPPDIVINTEQYSNVNCNGYNDGSVTITANGGTTPLTYNIGSGSQSDGNFSGLGPGIYNVTITDANGCTETGSVINISEPDLLQISLSGTDVSCNGGTDGAINLLVNGGTPLYTYDWSNGGWTEDLSNLPAGSYSVLVTDNNGCTVTNSIMLTEPETLVLTYSYTDVVCYGAYDATVTVNVTGGTPPMVYNIGTGAQGAGYFTDLGPGNYQVTVTDANGCSMSGNFFAISQPTDIIVNTEQYTQISCNGYDDGTINITASGGTTPLTYNMGYGVQGNGNFSNVSPGSYIVTITDANGCTETSSVIVITEPGLLQITISGSHVNCYGGSDGYIDLSVTGGTPLYSYFWSDFSLTEDISNLSDGAYSVTVTDNNGCTATNTYIITEPDSLHLSFTVDDANCNGYSDGTAQVIVSGGVLPYSYLWDSNTGYQNSATATSLEAGTYSVVITDANGCTIISYTTVDEPDALILAVSSTDVTCYESTDGSATVVATGGIPPYFYAWDANTGYQNTGTAEGLYSGDFLVTVTDAGSCTNTISVFVDQPPPVIVQASADVTICVGETADISGSASGGNGSYSYFWDNGIGYGQSHSVSPASTTTYTVHAYDFFGCSSDPDDVTVLVRNLFLDNIDVTSAGNICAGDSTIITGIHNGDMPPYFYSWNQNMGFDLGPYAVSPQDTTTYVLTISDICGNSINDSVTVEVYPYPEIGLPENISEGCQPLLVNFSDTINPEAYEYLWDFGDGSFSHLQDPTHVYYESGIHYITLSVTNPEGCTTTHEGISYVHVFPNPTPEIDADPIITDINNPTVYFNLDTLDYEYYTWEFGDGDTSYLPNPAHTYQDTGYYYVYLTVINQYECVNYDSILIIVEPDYDFLIPNAFTPVPGGPSGGAYDINAPNNDVFFPITEYVEDFHMMIFNRWGELIFETFDLNIGWDGYYDEKLCKQDVYVWKVEVTYVDGYQLVRAGTVTLVR